MSLADELHARDHQPMTRRCLHCDWAFHGDTATGFDAFLTHSLEAHGIPTRAAKRRARTRTFVSAKTLEQNIAGVRAAGSAVDHDGAP